ncbi:MAG: tetratricopeptide repeat protein, partial [Verrucomicrobia subdivision 3 bacterium]|nr:tetratricopeptide repeat protein [Limisphaerales bacterium]
LPPEGPGTPQADLYSLGKVLYEMSTGRDRKDYPLLPQDWDALDPAEQAQLLELNEVLVKVCEADPRRRYQSAGELRRDLELLQRGQSVRHQRAAKRRFALAKKFSISAVALTLLAGGAWKLFYSVSPRGELRTTGLINAADQRLLKERGTLNPQAYELYEKARAYAERDTREGFNQAVHYFNQSLRADPNNALAYTQLANIYRRAADWYLPPKHAMEEAKRNAHKAVTLNGASPAAHQALAWVRLLYDWDWLGASNSAWRTIELSPNTASCHALYATCLQELGHPDAALAEKLKAMQLAPDSIGVNIDLAWGFYHRREYTRALEACRKVLRANSNNIAALFLMGRSLKELGRYDEAVASFEDARSIEDSPDLIGWMGHTLALMGHREDALNLLADLEALSKKAGYVSAYWKAIIHAGLGTRRQAIDCLRLALADRSQNILEIRKDQVWDSFRSDPDFVVLVQALESEVRRSR